jgi:hypothetical protein
MKILFRKLILTGMLLIAPSQVFGWGSTEHKVIAIIAWENLTPRTRKAVVELMMRAPADSQVTALQLSDVNGRRSFFIAASVWADLVKNPAAQSRQMKYSCPLWRYAEFTFGEPGVEVPDLPGFKPRQVNVLERLQFFENALVDENEPISNRAVELFWTLHLVGDIHQPLHIASRVTKLEPGSDQGGNRFKLGNRNLHSFWDLALTNHYPRGDRSDDIYFNYLADLVTKKYPRTKLTSSLNRTKPEEWAAESFELARTMVYQGIDRGAMPSADYDRRALDVAESRIALAGYRLADMLNRLFGSARPQVALKAKLTDDSKQIKARLDYDLACVASTLDDKTSQLTVLKGTALEGQAEGREVTGFDSDNVKRIVSETREALLGTLEGEELAALRAYANKQFPDASKLETVRISEPRITLRKPLFEPTGVSVEKTNFSDYGLLPEVTISPVGPVNDLIGRVRLFIFGVRQRSGPISLEVITHPQTGANIVLQAPGGKRYATSTNSHINDFWPGTYSFTVTKDGFVTIAHSNVDLGFGNSVIDCQLVNSGTAVLCQFR